MTTRRPCAAGTRVAAGALSVALLAAAACARAPETAADIIDRSIQAHGGPALTGWKTMSVTGRVRMMDGIAYDAAYTLRAQAPGKLRVEHDLTADRGRAFYDYFLNDGDAWTRRNLVVSPFEVPRAQRLFDQCAGIAYYRQPSVSLARRADADVTWPAVEGWDAARIPGPRRAFVLTATIGTETRELFIDRETFEFLEERIGATTRYFAEVRAFGPLRLPTRILEVVRSQNRETSTPFTIDTVVLDAPLDPALFEEDRPRRK
jgi:hypothetical protein